MTPAARETQTNPQAVPDSGGAGVPRGTISLDKVLASGAIPGWSTQALAIVLARFGLTSEETFQLCALCAPARGISGLGRALHALVRLYPDDPRPRQWLAALRAWAKANPERGVQLSRFHHTVQIPVTMFLAQVSGRLPLDLARAIHVRLLNLVALHQSAKNAAYTLYVAAQHLAAASEDANQPNVAKKLFTGDYLSAIAEMSPPNVVLKKDVLETYRAALRNALGARKVPQRSSNAASPECHRGTVPPRSRRDADAERSSQPVTPSRPNDSSRGSLREVLASVVLSANSEDSVERHNHVRRAGGLTTKRANFIPEDLEDVDERLVARALYRLSTTDLIEQDRWTLTVLIRSIFSTGLPLRALQAVLALVDAETRGASLPASWYPAEVTTDRSVRVRFAREIIRELQSLSHSDPLFSLHGIGPTPVPAQEAHLSAVLRFLSAGDTCPLRGSMIRGAIWFSGRGQWPAEQLVLATTAWDPAFAKDIYYLHAELRFDATALHEMMLDKLAKGQRFIQDVLARKAFGVIH